MKNQAFLAIAERLMRHPAAPYHEGAVRAEAEAICREHGLDSEHDPFGNVLVRLRTAPRQQPLVLGAHLDHPVLKLRRRLTNAGCARFLGGVPDSYFRPGIRLRLLPGIIPASFGHHWAQRRSSRFWWMGRSKLCLPSRCGNCPISFCEKKKSASVCDDLIGVASILATMIDLKRSRARVHVIGVLSRAEEVGFQEDLCPS